MSTNGSNCPLIILAARVHHNRLSKSTPFVAPQQPTDRYLCRICQDIFLKLYKNGHLEEIETPQLYCEQNEKYLADRYVEGTCPICGYDDARGDQCDKCTNQINPIELINPRCKLCNSKPIVRNSSHLFIKLGDMQPQIEDFVKHASDNGVWTDNAIAMTRGWLKEGLKSRAMTRDLKWGVPVPLEGWEHKVMYVWFDAPIGYPSITACYTSEWEKWWKDPENVKLYQFMGKDNGWSVARAVYFKTLSLSHSTFPYSSFSRIFDWYRRLVGQIGFHQYNR